MGTIRHYVKQHKNNVKEVHTKGTIMTRNNFTEAVTQKQSNEKIPKSTQHTRRRPPTPTRKSSESQEAITLNSQICIGAPPRARCTPLEHPP